MRNFDILREMKDQVEDVKDILRTRQKFEGIGAILNKTWNLKRQLASKISDEKIDQMYESALKAGAIGGKISGAGGGGFLLLYVPRDKQNKVRIALKEYREFPFMLDPYGSKIIFNIRRDYWK